MLQLESKKRHLHNLESYVRRKSTNFGAQLLYRQHFATERDVNQQHQRCCAAKWQWGQWHGRSSANGDQTLHWLSCCQVMRTSSMELPTTLGCTVLMNDPNERTMPILLVLKCCIMLFLVDPGTHLCRLCMPFCRFHFH